MSDPRIPYIDLPVEIPPHTFPSIKIFGILVALGVYVGAIVTLRRARERHLDTKRMSDFIFWVVATGFVLSHVFDALLYHPRTVAADPLYLLKIWDGLSSYGGLIGAVIGAFLWKLVRRRPILEFVDVCVSAFPLAWVFGRLGCSSVHDHPGALTSSVIGIRYPLGYPDFQVSLDPLRVKLEHLCIGRGSCGQLVDGVYQGRYDLGLYEMLLTIPLATACWWFWKKQPFRAPGFYVGLTTAYYAPIRFGLDFLRLGPESGAGDERYAGLTPAQWVCFVALALGLYMLSRTLRPEAARAAVAEGARRAEEAELEEAARLEEEQAVAERRADLEAERARRATEDEAPERGARRAKRRDPSRDEATDEATDDAPRPARRPRAERGAGQGDEKPRRRPAADGGASRTKSAARKAAEKRPDAAAETKGTDTEAEGET